MELIDTSMTSLFAQLGEASDEASILRFMERHTPLPGPMHLYEGAFWSASQSTFLREALLLDAAWTSVVDELNVALHQTA